MSNTTYSNARKRQPPPAPTVDDDVAGDDYADGYEGEYDEYDEIQPSGSRGRVLALGGTIALLVIILSVVVWLLSSRTTTVAVDQGALAGGGRAPGQSPPQPVTGYFAPAFNMKDVHTNQDVSLASLKGQPVFINFWGTWCPPCRGEMPILEQVYQKYGATTRFA